MSKKTPVILIRSLDVKRGGVTKASITRANKLAEKYNEVIILTMLFQQNHKAIIEKMKAEKMLSTKVKVFNFFEDMKPKKRKLNIFNKTKYNTSLFEKGLTEIRDNKRKKDLSYRYYQNGIYVKYKRFTLKNELIFIDYMDESRHRIRREEYDEQGLLVRIRHMDINLNKPRLDRYFDYNQNCFMTVWINPKSSLESTTIIFSKTPKDYSDLNNLKSIWLQDILNKTTEPVVMCEQRSLDTILSKVSHKNIKKVGVVHVSHLSTPHVDITKIEKGYSRLFDNASYYDQIVLLTEEQKDDVINNYGDLQQLRVVPHVYQQKETKIKKNDFNPYLAVTLARFHQDKQLDEAIHAFRYVVDKIPSAEYHVYGYGPEKNKLKKIISDLDLKENVFLNDYTFNPSEVYQNASCSILTSKREGFGMVITESMAVGTPVVSYDFKYGPKDIIKNDINGFIIPAGNKKEMAEKIIDIMTNENTYKKLSKNSLNVRNTFSEKKYIDKWVQVIDEN